MRVNAHALKVVTWNRVGAKTSSYDNFYTLLNFFESGNHKDPNTINLGTRDFCKYSNDLSVVHVIILYMDTVMMPLAYAKEPSYHYTLPIKAPPL